MGLTIHITPEKVIKVCTQGLAWEEARWAKYRLDTIKSISDHLREKAANSWWRKLLGAPKKGYDCDQEAIATFDNPSWEGGFLGKHIRHEVRKKTLSDFILAAKASDSQLMAFSGDDAVSISVWLERDLTIPA